MRGLCRACYVKKRREDKRSVRRGGCSIEGCPEPHNAKGFCEDHYYRWKRYGDPHHTIRVRKGTGFINDDGYRVITHEGRRRLEHRVVMERRLGRKLLTHETVHHINGKRADNRDGNLELWISRHPPGQRVEDHIKWARKLLATYGNLFPE